MGLRSNFCRLAYVILLTKSASVLLSRIAANATYVQLNMHLGIRSDANVESEFMIGGLTEDCLILRKSC